MCLEASFADGPTRSPAFCFLIVVSHIFDYPAPETDHEAKLQTVSSQTHWAMSPRLHPRFAAVFNLNRAATDVLQQQLGLAKSKSLIRPFFGEI